VKLWCCRPCQAAKCLRQTCCWLRCANCRGFAVGIQRAAFYSTKRTRIVVNASGNMPLAQKAAHASAVVRDCTVVQSTRTKSHTTAVLRHGVVCLRLQPSGIPGAAATYLLQVKLLLLPPRHILQPAQPYSSHAPQPTRGFDLGSDAVMSLVALEPL
jgi:hypothetical protein